MRLDLNETGKALAGLLCALAFGFAAQPVEAQASRPQSSLERAIDTAQRFAPPAADMKVVRYDFWEEIGRGVLSGTDEFIDLRAMQAAILQAAVKASGRPIEDWNQLQTNTSYGGNWDKARRPVGTLISHEKDKRAARSRAIRDVISHMEAALEAGDVPNRESYDRALRRLREEYERMLWLLNQGGPSEASRYLCRLVLARMAQEKFGATLDFTATPPCRINNREVSFDALRTKYGKHAVRTLEFEGSNVIWIIALAQDGTVHF
jgi:hypothetical protein